MTVQRREFTSTITSESGHCEEVNTSGLSTLPSASASSSLSATVPGFSTGDGPINLVPNTAVDLTVQEFTNTDGTTENVEDLQSRMPNQYEDNQYAQQYDQPIDDNHGIAVGMIMAEQRRAREQIIPISTISNEEEGDQLMDTTGSPIMSTTTTTVVLTTLTNVSTPSAPAAAATINALEMARQTLNINRGGVAAMPQVGQTPRSRQGSGDTAGRGRRRIAAARGDVAKAAEKYYEEMLKIQQANAAKYDQYLTEQIDNQRKEEDRRQREEERKKIQHDKDMEIKEVRLQIARKQLENLGQSTPSTLLRPPRSAAFEEEEPQSQ